MAVFAAVLGGCAEPRLYPVCLYNQSIPKEILAREYIPKLEYALKVALGDDRPIALVASPDNRWLVAGATDDENKYLAKIWPRIGCIGIASDSTGVLQEADCAAYLQEFIESGNYASFGVHLAPGGIKEHNEAPNSKLLVFCDPTFSPLVANTKQRQRTQ